MLIRPFVISLLILDLLCEKHFPHLLHRHCRLNIDPLALNLVLVSNLEHKVDASDVGIGDEPESSRSLRPLILQDHDVVDCAKLLEVSSKLDQL